MGDNRFGHFKRNNVTASSTSRFELTEAGVTPVPILLVKPATEVNKPYQQALLKSVGKRARKLDGAALEKIRREDARLYPKYVIYGWEDLTDVNGDPVEFSQEVCAEFIKSLPNWVFDEIRSYCSEITNFVDDDPVDVEVVEDLGND